MTTSSRGTFDPLQSRQPDADEHTEGFWSALRDGRLVVQGCPEGHVQLPPSTVCKTCWTSEGLDWIAASGRGEIESYSIVHRPPTAEFVAGAPYAVALVRLDEGPRLMATVTGIDDGDVDWCEQAVTFVPTLHGLVEFEPIARGGIS